MLLILSFILLLLIILLAFVLGIKLITIPSFVILLPLRVKYLQEDVLKWILILAQSLPQHLFFINFLGLFLYKVNRFYLQFIYIYFLNVDKVVILYS